MSNESLIMPKNATPEDEEEDLLLNVICFTCPYLSRCGLRSEHNPIECVWLRDWIYEGLEIYETWDYEEEGEKDKDDEDDE